MQCKDPARPTGRVIYLLLKPVNQGRVLAVGAVWCVRLVGAEGVFALWALLPRSYCRTSYHAGRRAEVVGRETGALGVRVHPSREGHVYLKVSLIFSPVCLRLPLA